MVAWGDIAKRFNANNVLFKMGTVPDSPDTVEEIILLKRFRMVKTIPVNRSIVRAGVSETPNPIIREFLITAECTEDLYDKLEAVSEPTTRGGFHIEDFEMVAQAISGVSDDITLDCDGFVRQLEGIAIENEKMEVDFIVRVDNNTVVIS